MQTETPVLTPGEWECVLYQSPSQIAPLIIRLAVYHGHMKAVPGNCPICDAPRKQEQQPQPRLPL